MSLADALRALSEDTEDDATPRTPEQDDADIKALRSFFADFQPLDTGPGDIVRLKDDQGVLKGGGRPAIVLKRIAPINARDINTNLNNFASHPAAMEFDMVVGELAARNDGKIVTFLVDSRFYRRF